MNIVLRALIICACLAFIAYVIHLIKHERLLLKYSLLWLVFSLIMLLCAIFPGIVGQIADAFGFVVTSNFVFFVGMGLLIVICLALTSIVSWQAIAIKDLTQRLALVAKSQEADRGDSFDGRAQ